MEKVILYKANDGSTFNTEEACINYENSVKDPIINRFRKLIVAENEGIQITKEGSSFPMAEICECWWFAKIILHNEDDYKAVIKYAKLCNMQPCQIDRIMPIYNKEILVSIGDGSSTKCEYNWCYWYGTIDNAVKRYKETLMKFGK